MTIHYWRVLGVVTLSRDIIIINITIYSHTWWYARLETIQYTLCELDYKVTSDGDNNIDINISNIVRTSINPSAVQSLSS